MRTAIIIGAPRSGTNMLRDMLTSLPGVGTWPCDEINYIWRHGNVRYPSDELPADLATPRVQNYVLKQFKRIAAQTQASLVVEKTCANSLRVDYVDQIVPDAKYIFIRRDGYDAVGSALERWRAKMDFPYLAAKARYVPLSDLPYYASRYLWNHGYRLLSGKKQLAFWGPRMNGFAKLVEQHTLEEVCALQWQRCVESAASALARLPAERVIEVAYERLTVAPSEEIRRLANFLGLMPAESDIARSMAGVSPASIGKGRRTLGQSGVDKLRPLISPTLERYGYA